MTVTLYGIRNCDTMKKAWSWLDAHGIAYALHDYKKAGIDRDHLERWCDEAGWEKVLNRAGMTFRKLSDAEKQDIDRDKAIALMLSNPSMVKRPVLEDGERMLVGFKPEIYADFFGKA